MSTNRPILTKDPSGDNLSQKRARVTLPILVRQAMASQRITYGNLGKELGLHHRALRHPLGCIGDTLLELSKRWQEDVPPIQGLVVNQETGMPGESVNFLYGRKPDPREKEAIVEAVLGKVFSYPKWLDVLEAFGLSPAEPLNPRLEQPEDHRSRTRESEAHKRFKNYIAHHPRAVGLKKVISTWRNRVSVTIRRYS